MSKKFLLLSNVYLLLNLEYYWLGWLMVVCVVVVEMVGGQGGWWLADDD